MGISWSHWGLELTQVVHGVCNRPIISLEILAQNAPTTENGNYLLMCNILAHGSPQCVASLEGARVHTNGQNPSVFVVSGAHFETKVNNKSLAFPPPPPGLRPERAQNRDNAAAGGQSWV